MRRVVNFIVEFVAIVAAPSRSSAFAASGVDQAALLSLVVAVASLVLFFAGYEKSAPRLRDTMPVVVLAALAAAGRILFAPFPSFKPVSAIAIIAGAAFGRRSGFMVGAIAALVSNFFFGQGPSDSLADVRMGPHRLPRRRFGSSRRVRRRASGVRARAG